MSTAWIVFTVLMASCLINAIGDVILLWGVRNTNWEPGLEALAQTPERFVLFGSLLGLLVIPAWFLICPYLANIDGLAGKIAFMSFATYVAAVFSFHVCYAFVGVGIQALDSLQPKFEPLVGIIAGYSFLAATIFTVAMIFAGLTKAISMSWFHYATLPVFTIILFQMALGNVFKSVPYFQAASGTFAMALFFYGFIDMVSRNPNVFDR